MVTWKQQSSMPKRNATKRKMRITSSKGSQSAMINTLKEATLTTDGSRGAVSNMLKRGAMEAVAIDARVATEKTAIEREGIRMKVSRARSYSRR